MTGGPAPFDPAAWTRAAGRRPLYTADRLVVGQLSGRADRRGQVRATTVNLASATCLPPTTVQTALAVLSSYGLLGRADRALVPVIPDQGAER